MTVPFGRPIRIIPYAKPPGCLARLLAWLTDKLRAAIVILLIFLCGYGCRAITVQ